MESPPKPDGGVSAARFGRWAVQPHIGLLMIYFSWSLAALLATLLQVVAPVWVLRFRLLRPIFRVLDPVPSAAEPMRPPDVLVRLVDSPAHVVAEPCRGRITPITS
jgi:hypothetical protein